MRRGLRAVPCPERRNLPLLVGVLRLGFVVGHLTSCEWHKVWNVGASGELRLSVSWISALFSPPHSWQDVRNTLMSGNFGQGFLGLHRQRNGAALVDRMRSASPELPSLTSTMANAGGPRHIEHACRAHAKQSRVATRPPDTSGVPPLGRAGQRVVAQPSHCGRLAVAVGGPLECALFARAVDVRWSRVMP